MIDVLFVTPTEEFDIRQESNGTMLLATKLLQAGFEANLLRFCEEEHYNKDYTAFVNGMTEKILAAAPRCVSFYTVWPYYHIMLRIAKQVKERCPEMWVVFGGPQVSATVMATMQAMEFIDCVSTGEGEDIVVPFFTALLRGGDLSQVPGLYYRADGEIKCNLTELPLCDLNTLPHWDDRLYTYEMSPKKAGGAHYYMPIDAGRGCPYNCSFCCTSHFWRRTYRLKTAARIVEDIRYYKDKFGITSFWFSHDAFTTNKKLVEEVCDHMMEQDLGITWRCSTRIDCITEDLVLKMKQAGLKQIEVGIETGSERMQKLTHKNLDLVKAKSKIEFMIAQGIVVDVFFMYGFPEETVEDLRKTLALLFELLDLGVHHASMAYTRFNPATQITEDHFDELVIDKKIKVLTRGVFGCEEEWKMIEENKEIFPFFYHLNTPVRNEYQYLIFLVHVYHLYPYSIRYLRQLYQYDDLKMYEDFCSCNEECFAGDMAYATQCVTQHSLQMLERMLDKMDDPHAEQVRGLLRYDRDVHAISKEEEGTKWEKTYDFNIMDLQRKRPLEKFGQAKTTILLEKADKRGKMKILNIE